MLQVKICGITQAEQGRAIAQRGATALGFIGVPQSPRYVTVEQMRAIATQLPAEVERVGVFVNLTLSELTQIVPQAKLTAVQLHGEESPDLCRQLRDALPQTKLIKALRVKQPDTLSQIDAYVPWVDALLLDAYHPTQRGGTGTTLDWSALPHFRPPVPWLLAGGLTPDNVCAALNLTCPDGIDLSSGVETQPGIKNLDKVDALFTQLQQLQQVRNPTR